PEGNHYRPREGNPVPLSRRRISMSRMVQLAIGLSLMIGLGGCGHSKGPSTSVDTLRRGLSGEPSSLDPAAATDTFSTQVLQDLYEGLTSESPSGSVVPA